MSQCFTIGAARQNNVPSIAKLLVYKQARPRMGQKGLPYLTLRLKTQRLRGPLCSSCPSSVRDQDARHPLEESHHTEQLDQGLENDDNDGGMPDLWQ